MQTLVPLYLYAGPDANILLCNPWCSSTYIQILVWPPGSPIPVCKPWCSYTYVQAQMVLYRYVALGALIPVCKLG